jgi:hypothetical protein
MIEQDRKSRNMNAATLTDATRSALGLLIEREERRVGSRDLAFDVVARTVGTSASWLKKFLGRHTEVKEPRITLYLNIREAYENLCNRVEQEHRREEARITALRKQINAPIEGFIEMVASTSGKTTA